MHELFPATVISDVLKSSRSMIYYTHKHKVTHTNARGWDCDICLTICWGRIVFGARDTHNSHVNATAILRFLCSFFLRCVKTHQWCAFANTPMNVIPFVKSSTNTYNVTKTIELWFGIYLALVYFVFSYSIYWGNWGEIFDKFLWMFSMEHLSYWYRNNMTGFSKDFEYNRPKAIKNSK